MKSQLKFPVRMTARYCWRHFQHSSRRHVVWSTSRRPGHTEASVLLMVSCIRQMESGEIISTLQSSRKVRVSLSRCFSPSLSLKFFHSLQHLGESWKDIGNLKSWAFCAHLHVTPMVNANSSSLYSAMMQFPLFERLNLGYDRAVCRTNQSFLALCISQWLFNWCLRRSGRSVTFRDSATVGVI